MCHVTQANPVVRDRCGRVDVEEAGEVTQRNICVCMRISQILISHACPRRVSIRCPAVEDGVDQLKLYRR